MSRDNVETVSAFVEAAGRDPKQGSSYLADDLEFAPFRHLDGPARGPAGFMSRVEEISSHFETYTVRAERLEQVGELVVADLRREATTTRGPAVIEDRFAQVFTLRDGKIVRVDSFSTFDEALKAAALREKATSHENVEVVRSAYAAVNEGRLDILAEITAPDAVLDWSRSIGPQRGIYRGRDAFARYWVALAEAFEKFQLSPVDVVVAPGGEIVVRHHVSARGRASGLEIDRVPDVALVWKLRDGKVTKTTLFQPHAEALEAVGLAE